MNEGRNTACTDAFGVPVTQAARVTQVKVHKPHGGLVSRLGKHGVVTTTQGETRVAVRFDGEATPVRLRPYLLHVIKTVDRTEPGPVELPEERVENFHWHGYAEARWHVVSTPTRSTRDQRLVRLPDAVLRSPLAVADWVGRTTADAGACFALWEPISERWVEFDGPDLAALRQVFLTTAAQARSVYAAAWTEGGGRVEVFAEAVSADDCRQRDHHRDVGAAER